MPHQSFVNLTFKVKATSLFRHLLYAHLVSIAKYNIKCMNSFFLLAWVTVLTKKINKENILYISYSYKYYIHVCTCLKYKDGHPIPVYIPEQEVWRQTAVMSYTRPSSSSVALYWSVVQSPPWNPEDILQIIKNWINHAI